MKPLEYYQFISDCIDTFACKGDLIINGEFEEKDFEALLSLACLWTGYYHQPFPIEIDQMSVEMFNSQKGKKKKGKRKQMGQFFTPPYIAEYITKETIGPLIEKILGNKKIKNKVEAIYRLTVCDPAMGAGIFLVKAHDLLFEYAIGIGQPVDEKGFLDASKKTMKCIYGLDIDKKAVELATIALQLNHAKHGLIWKLEEFANVAEIASL